MIAVADPASVAAWTPAGAGLVGNCVRVFDADDPRIAEFWARAPRRTFTS